MRATTPYRVCVFAVFLLTASGAAAAYPAGEHDPPDELLSRSQYLETAGELETALRLAEEAEEAGGGVPATLRIAWLNYRLGNLEVALLRYREAGIEAPDRRAPMLGETLVLTLLERWEDLESAALRLTTRFPDSPWGWVRLGRARLERGALAASREAYEEALARGGADGEALLGLGFVARAEGKTQEASRHCDRAAAFLGDEDPRLAACRTNPPVRPSSARPLVRPALWSMVAGADRHYTIRSIWAVAGELELIWPSGTGLHVGLAYSRADLRFDEDDRWLLMPGASVFHAARDWRAGLSYLFMADKGTDAADEHIVDAWGGGQLGPVGLGAEVTGILSSTTTGLQSTLTFAWGRPGDVLVPYVSPAITWWPRGPEDLDGVVHASGTAGLAWHATTDITLELAGWYGRRRHWVDSYGRFVWNTDEVFTGGWRIGLWAQLSESVSLVARLRHDVGIEQSGKSFLFHLFTTQLGLVLSL